MKTRKLLFFSILLISIGAKAQYGNNQYGNTSGRLRTNPFPKSSPSKPSTEDIEEAKSKKIDAIMAKLKTDLSLDELQFIAIKNEIVASNSSIEIVMKKEKSEEDKSNDIKAINEKTDKTINSYLNADQKVKYLKRKEDKALNKDEKKKKREKKDKTSEE